MQWSTRLISGCDYACYTLDGKQVRLQWSTRLISGCDMSNQSGLVSFRDVAVVAAAVQRYTTIALLRIRCDRLQNEWAPKFVH